MYAHKRLKNLLNDCWEKLHPKCVSVLWTLNLEESFGHLSPNAGQVMHFVYLAQPEYLLSMKDFLKLLFHNLMDHIGAMLHKVREYWYEECHIHSQYKYIFRIESVSYWEYYGISRRFDHNFIGLHQWWKKWPLCGNLKRS